MRRHPDNFTGRAKILIDETVVDESNIFTVLNKCMLIHLENSREIDYLWKYYKGKQPVYKREKKTRKDIKNNVCVNLAYEIATFFSGFLCGKPIQYVGVDTGAEIAKKIGELNSFMASENKASQDRNLFEWLLACGVAYRLVLPDDGEEDDGEELNAPFEIYTLDPRNTFIAYDNTVKHRPVMGVTYVEDDKGNTIFGVYTKDRYYKISGDVANNAMWGIQENTPHILGDVPIIEYVTNEARLGIFEPVLSMLDAISIVASNRVDSVGAIVDAFYKFVNCNITEEQFDEFIERGAIKVASSNGLPADVQLITNSLDQSQTQTLIDDMSQTVFEIVGMPSRTGRSSTADTGSAVMLRDGWSQSESRAEDIETKFKESENRFLKMVLKICRKEGLDLSLRNIDTHFTRRNYEAYQSKAQVLVSMLACDKIAPIDAFTQSGMFADPESACARGMANYETNMKAEEERLLNELARNVQPVGRGDSESNEDNSETVQ